MQGWSVFFLTWCSSFSIHSTQKTLLCDIKFSSRIKTMRIIGDRSQWCKDWSSSGSSKSLIFVISIFYNDVNLLTRFTLVHCQPVYRCKYGKLSILINIFPFPHLTHNFQSYNLCNRLLLWNVSSIYKWGSAMIVISSYATLSLVKNNEMKELLSQNHFNRMW